MSTTSIKTKAVSTDENPIETNTLQDPFPAGRFLGKRLSVTVAGRRLAGKCVKQTYIGRTKRGDIPNYRLRIQLQSGHSVEVNMVEQYTIFR